MVPAAAAAAGGAANAEPSSSSPHGMGETAVVATQPPQNSSTVTMLNTQIAQLRHTNAELSKRLHVALVSAASLRNLLRATAARRLYAVHAPSAQ